MAYSTAEDLLFRISDNEIKEFALDSGEEDDEAQAAQVARAIEDADAEIDAWAGRRYSVPLVTVHPLIRKISVDIAIKNLFSRRVEKMPKSRQADYDNALKLLKEIASGALYIGLGAISGGPSATHTDEDRDFTLGKVSDDSTGTLDGF